MNFDFSDDQKMLREQARKFLDETSSRKAVREVLNDPGKSYDAALWKAVAEQGWLGVAIPEAFGGLGLGGLELCVLAEEIGRAVAPIPFSSTLYFFGEAVLAAGSAAQKKALLPKIVSGDLIGAFAISEGPGAPSPSSIEASFDGSKLSGMKIPVTDGDIATHAVVLAREGGGLSLVLVDLNQPGVKRETLATLDPTRGHAPHLRQGKRRTPRQGRAGLGAGRGRAQPRRGADRLRTARRRAGLPRHGG
jgi:alkylation response protein AidB-like acyl-CoA dehydrogenase